MASVAVSLALAGGSMVLNYLFRPKVKQEPIDKGKMDDIRITSSEYGAFIPRVWGKARVGGNLIWSSGVTHTIIETPSGGGKGVPQAPATRTHIYTTSIAVLISRGVVSNFLRTWADADLILYNGGSPPAQFEAEDATLTGGASVVSDSTASNSEYVGNLGSGGKATFDLSSVIDPELPSDDPDEMVIPYTRITFFYKSPVARQAVITCTVDGSPFSTTKTFPATGSNWTTLTFQRRGFASALEFANPSGAAPDLDLIKVEKYLFVNTDDNPSPAPFQPTYKITGAINQDIIYPPDIDDPSEYYNAPLAEDNGKIALNFSSELTRYYTGTEGQTQDSAIIAWLDSRYGSGEGVLRAPAHRGLAYVVFENRTLKQARVENFTFEIDCENNDVNDILGDLFSDVGLESSDYDLTATAGLSQLGFVEHTKMTRRANVEYLERYHLFRIAEIDGKIRTVPDSVEPITTISADLLRAHNDGEEMPIFDAEIVLKEESLFPREVRVSVMNPDLEYHNEAVPSQLFASVPSTESKEYTFPIVDKATTARTVAEKLILKEHTEDKAVEFFGMPEMAKYSVGDVLTVPLGGIDTRVRIEKKQMGLPIGKIRFHAVTVSPFAPVVIQDDFTQLASKAVQQFAAFNFPRNSIVIPILSKPLTARDRGKLGLYLAVSGRGRGSSENIAIYREFDEDNFIRQYVADNPSIAGLCEDVLGTHVNSAVEDTTNVLDIWFFDDIELESVLQADIDRYPTLNLLRVGDEWIQFRTATAQTLEENSPYRSKWRVENLWRGRFETDSSKSTHVADEYAVLYTNAVRFFELDNSDIGEDITLKAVTNGQAEENGQMSTFTFTPYSGYAVSNAAEDRTFDANSVTLNELADVVATIIEDSNL